jgi:glycosyltransferase involved in cell wall biosynthesis
MRRLAIVTTHPIQYYAPLFRELAKHLSIKVFYTWSQSKGKIFDEDFGIERQWDIPLLEGYSYTFVNNIATHPGSSHFTGIKNPSLIKEVEAWNPDAILIFGWAFISHLKALLYFHKKVPLLFRGDSTLLDESPGFSVKKIVRRYFLKWVYRHIDYALYVGKANKQYFIAHGVKEHQLIFAPHAIDNKRFADSAADVQEKSKSLGIDAGDIVFLFAGKLIKKKNPDFLIRSFLKVARNKSSVKLIIAGNGELKEFLKQQYAQDNNVIFLNFQNQTAMPALYKTADVFVLPSQGPGETWGLAVNEAMACSKALLVSDKCGCAADLVQAGVNGYLFKSNDEEDISTKIYLMLDKQKLQAMGRNSFARVQYWSYDKTVLAIKNLT